MKNLSAQAAITVAATIAGAAGAYATRGDAYSAFYATVFLASLFGGLAAAAALGS